MPEPPADEELKTYIAEIAQRIDTTIEKQIGDKELSSIYELLHYQTASGGKRLRPVLAALVSQALGGDLEDTISVATSCEMIHSGSLAIDDCMDRDLFRRGKPAVHNVFTVGAAWMSGNVLAILGMKVGMQRNMTMARVLMDTGLQLLLGQTEEKMLRNLDERTYLRVIRMKTASLFSAATQIGALMAFAKPELVEAAARYGHEVGMMYQLVDDLVPVLQTLKKGEPIEDVREGKATLAFVYANEKATQLQKDHIQAFIHNPPPTKEVTDVLIAALNETEAVQRVEKAIEARIEAALSALKSFPDSKFKTMLAAMPAYMRGALMAEVG